MKKSIVKFTALIIMILMIISIIQLPIMATTKEESLILKKSEKQFIIYYKDTCNNEFQFAISQDKNAKEESLIFTNSVKDQLTENALNVAYIDETTYDTIFTNNTKAYIWIKDEKDNTIVKADEIDLSNVLKDDIVSFVNNTTKRIQVDESQKYVTSQEINGVETSITVGKLVIKGKEDSNYYYKIVKADETNPDEKELFDLAEKIEKGTENTYESLELTKKFYKLYNELIPISTWKEVENSEILQPKTARDGDKYIVWIKEKNKNEEIIDTKFLVSEYEYTPDYKNEDKVIKETVKLPVTYDSIALIVIFSIIIIAIVVVAILKVKSGKKRRK